MSIVSLKDYRWDGSKKLELKDAETGAPEFVDKKNAQGADTGEPCGSGGTAG